MEPKRELEKSLGLNPVSRESVLVEQNPSLKKTELTSETGADTKFFKMKNLFFVFAFVVIGFCANAQIEVLTNGNVGIGTSNPQAKLDVSGSTVYLAAGVSIGRSGSHYDEIGYNIGFTGTSDVYTYRRNNYAASIRMGSNGSIAFRTAPQGTVGASLTLTERMRIALDGKVGIGTSNPAFKLDVNGDGRFGNDARNVILGTYTYRDCWWQQNTNPAVYSLGSNRLFLGTPINWAYCTYSSNIYYTSQYWYATTTNVTPCINIFQERIVDILQDVNVYLADVGALSIRGSDTDTNSRNESDCPQKQYVFLAEELQQVFPELVSTLEDGEAGETKLAINYTGMIPILTAAINEQQEIINQLQGTVNELPQIEIGVLQQIVNDQQVAIIQLQMENVQQQETINQHQVQIEMLQQIAWGQELDLTELYELRDRVNVLDNKVDVMQQTIEQLRRVLLICCTGTVTDMRQQDSTLLSDSNQISKNKNPQTPVDAVLYQTKPSSFSSNTDISCYVPAILDSAFTYVYNLQGIQIKSFPLTQGHNIVTISASELPAGMYLYTLVVDDEIIDSKRMILTK